MYHILIMNTVLDRLFLIGGGWTEGAFEFTYGPFVRAARRDTGLKIALIIALEDEDDRVETEARLRGPFEQLSVGSDEISVICVSANQPLTKDMLAASNPTGVFVCGGSTPLYQEALCLDRGWLDYVAAEKLPYGGFSAGSSIAAERAVVGGWKLPVGETEVPIIDEEVGEDLDLLAVRDGLGFLPVSIDVHCGQWGTITRLIHAVDSGMIETGLGIDEDTMVSVEGGVVSVCGFGQVYRITKTSAGAISVEIFRAGDLIDL